MAFRRSANSNRTCGNGINSGFSSRANTIRLESSRFWNGLALMPATSSKIASLSSANPTNRRLRNTAATWLATNRTLPSTTGLSRGFLTLAGMIAVP